MNFRLCGPDFFRLMHLFVDCLFEMGYNKCEFRERMLYMGVYSKAYLKNLEGRTGADDIDELFQMYAPKITRAIHESRDYSKQAVEAAKEADKDIVDGIHALDRSNDMREDRFNQKLDQKFNELTDIIREKDRQIAEMHEILKNFPEVGRSAQGMAPRRSNSNLYMPFSR